MNNIESEFWLTLVVILAATSLCVMGKLDGNAWSVVCGASGVGYSMAAKARKDITKE